MADEPFRIEGSYVVVTARRTRKDVTFLFNGYPFAGPWWVDWIEDADDWYAREVVRQAERAPA